MDEVAQLRQGRSAAPRCGNLQSPPGDPRRLIFSVGFEKPAIVPGNAGAKVTLVPGHAWTGVSFARTLPGAIVGFLVLAPSLQV